MGQDFLKETATLDQVRDNDEYETLLSRLLVLRGKVLKGKEWHTLIETREDKFKILNMLGLVPKNHKDYMPGKKGRHRGTKSLYRTED